MADELDYVPLPDAGEGSGAQAVGRRSRTRPASRSRSSDRPAWPRHLAAARPSSAASGGPWPLTLPAIPYEPADQWSDRCRMARPPERRACAPWADGCSRCCAHGAAWLTLRAAGRHHRVAGLRRLAGDPANSAWASCGPREWDPVQEKFGGLVMIYGTLMTSFIALLIAVPVSFGIALFLTELSPALAEAAAGHRHRIARRRAVDRLRHVGPAGVRPDPRHVRAAAAAERSSATCRSSARCSPGRRSGIGILSAGIILAIMIIPFIASVMRDVFEVTPPMLKESAYGLGSTTWEVVWQGGAALHQDRRRSAASCSAWAARWARPWR